jgi:hypothetical protein
MSPPLEDVDWRVIAAQASKEMDPEKLTRLIAKLCRSLDEHNQKARVAKASRESGLDSSENPMTQ